IFAYIDDFIVCTDTFERHIEILEMIATKLNEAGLQIGLKKSKFCMKRLKFLGHMIDERGVSIDESRVQAIKDYKRPTTVREIQSFLGLTGWHRKFVEGFSDLAAPLVNLTKKDKKFEWKSEHENAFNRIKTAMSSAPVLANPNYSKPFQIQAKSSEIGVSAILIQIYENKKHTIAYMSAKFSDIQCSYHPVEKECLAVILALEKFRHYVEGNKITVITDHNSLVWLKNCQDPTGRIARWSLRLQAYDFEIQHRKFSQNEPVCVLSREIDLDKAPIVNIEMCSFDLLSHSEAMLDDEWSKFYLSESIEAIVNFPFEINTVEVNDSLESTDNWYGEKYAKAEENKNSKNYKIEKNQLYHRFDSIHKPFELEWKICVPIEEREKVLYEQHDCVSHPGFLRTLRRIQEMYYWPKQYFQVSEYVSKCEICRTTKASNVNTHTEMGNRRETDFPFRVLAADFVGPMTMSKKQNQHLFVVVDLFTKYVWIKPLRVAKSEHIIKFLQEDVFHKFGVCERFICDNGVQFTSKDFQQFMTKFGTQICYTPYYYPRANPCEIANKTIVNAIRAYVAQMPDQRTWDAEISTIACAINNHIHTSIDFSPYFSIHGHKMILNGQEYIRIVDVNNDSENETHEDRMYVIRKQMSEHLLKAHERIMKTHNKIAGSRQIDLNKETYLKNQKLSNAGDRYSKKLGLKYIPVKIVKKLGSNTFLISDESGKVLGKYHASFLMQK
ncbi:hypothetical protein EON73_00740, partial [bacterium]